MSRSSRKQKKRLEIIEETEKRLEAGLGDLRDRIGSLSQEVSGRISPQIEEITTLAAGLHSKSDDPSSVLTAFAMPEANLVIKADDAMTKLDKLRQSAGFLHQKADDAVIKQRPSCI